MNIINDIQQNMFAVFLISFFLYYNLVVERDPKAIFFVFAILIIFYMLRNDKAKKAEKANANIATYIENVQHRLSNDFEVPENKIYYVHKTPRTLKYIQQTTDIRQLIYDLKFLNIYDKALYDKIVSYVEYFLKIHYKVMIGKYEFDYYFPMLKDLRTEILNMMKTIFFNIPKVSRIMYIKDIDAYVDEKLHLMQAKTYKYLKILHHKYGKNHVLYQAPFEFDPAKDDHYHVF